METTLFDKNGNPIAYISPHDGNAIYMWDGNAVCYLDGEKVYGWQGSHIGWYINDIIYDIDGLRIGFTKKTCPVLTYSEPIKYIKYVQYVKYVKYLAYSKPMLSFSLSNKDLKNFLEQDKP